MKAIGIDVASGKLNIHVTEGGGDFEIPNTTEAVQDFVKKHQLKPEQYLVGCESTAKYHYIAQKFFVEAGFEFYLLNPLVTKQFTAATIRKKKTDKTDARIIAQFVEQRTGTKITTKQLDTARRSLLRARSTVLKDKSGLQKMLAQLKKEEMSESLKAGLRAVEEAVEVLEKTALQLREQALSSEQSPIEKLLCTIPGIAHLTASVIVAEVGEFNRFPSSNQFKAYVGIDPKVIQSGNSSKFGRITKRGNPSLRCALYLSAQVARQHDPELKAFFQKKRAEGKPFRVAVCAVSRKLCERVYAVATRQLPYIIRQLQTA